MGDRADRVVIVGGGFGGLHAARALGRAGTDVTLIDRRNFHLFQPLLYQVAPGALSPANIAAPLRSVLRRYPSCRVVLAEASGVDVDCRVVKTDQGDVPYHTLVLATGVAHSYFGHAAWEKDAPGLKTVEDATEMRRRILSAFERAEMEEDEEARRALLTFVLVGGGPTGVELAGALAEIARHTLRDQFRTIDPSSARILLIEAGPRVLPAYAGGLPEKARNALESLGVEVWCDASVHDVGVDGVAVLRGGREERIRARTVLWAAGVAASPLGKAVAEATGTATDRSGRVKVLPDLPVAGHPEVFVIGDLMSAAGPDGKPLPGVAQVAMQQGRHVARTIAARLQGRSGPGPFLYRDPGSMATIGRGHAVADLGFVRFGGTLAWLAWLFIHLMYLVQFGNRLLILVQWAWNYLTWNRSARLITGGNSCPSRRS